MCLGVYAKRYDTGKGTHVSVFAYLMRGDNDDNLKWPFKGTIKVSLLNQLDEQHHMKLLWSPIEYISKDASGRLTWRGRACKGWGKQKFISHQDLNYCGGRNHQYLKDNTLFLRVDRFE